LIKFFVSHVGGSLLILPTD